MNGQIIIFEEISKFYKHRFEKFGTFQKKRKRKQYINNNSRVSTNTICGPVSVEWKKGSWIKKGG